MSALLVALFPIGGQSNSSGNYHATTKRGEVMKRISVAVILLVNLGLLSILHA
jgi:hypothetical protein